MVQEAVVSHVDEKLRRSGVWVAGAGHGHRVVGVLQAVVGFVLDGGVAISLLHAGLHAAALNHESRNNAVEDGAVVMAFLHIGQKVLD